jgi:hypothetical protein
MKAVWTCFEDCFDSEQRISAYLQRFGWNCQKGQPAGKGGLVFIITEKNSDVICLLWFSNGFGRFRWFIGR